MHLVLFITHIELWSIVHYYFRFHTCTQTFIDGPPKDKFLAPPLVITITDFHYNIFNVQDTEIIKKDSISKLYLHQISYKN